MICYICEREITIDSKIAKVISIKVMQRDGEGAQIEYQNDQEDIYLHITCLAKFQNNINICDPVLGIIDKEQILCPSKNEESLIRNNILNF